MHKIVKGTETNKWLPMHWRKSTFPVLKQPAQNFDDIHGTAFLLQYKNKPFIVTASHVIKTENPAVAFNTTNRQIRVVNTSAFEKIGLNWIKHPAGLDLAAIPFIAPINLSETLDLLFINEDKWSPLTTFKVNDIAVHLGYPEKGCSNFTGGTRSVFPQSMPGKIIQINPLLSVMETAGVHGASGGPVFINRNKKPFLVGVVTDAAMDGVCTRPHESAYCDKTKFLPISLVKDILESKEITLQLQLLEDKFSKPTKK